MTRAELQQNEMFINNHLWMEIGSDADRRKLVGAVEMYKMVKHKYLTFIPEFSIIHPFLSIKTAHITDSNVHPVYWSKAYVVILFDMCYDYP